MSSAPTEIERLGRLPDSLWQQLRERPERAPELIALAAAERFAGPAEEWVRIAGAGHTHESLAKVAYKKHVRLARVEGLAFGLGGVVTSAFNLAGLAWIQARMVFYVAAAHGYDPHHPMRPAERGNGDGHRQEQGREGDQGHPTRGAAHSGLPRDLGESARRADRAAPTKCLEPGRAPLPGAGAKGNS